LKPLKNEIIAVLRRRMMLSFVEFNLELGIALL
jgi:hypothetical protein